MGIYFLCLYYMHVDVTLQRGVHPIQDNLDIFLIFGGGLELPIYILFVLLLKSIKVFGHLQYF